MATILLSTHDMHEAETLCDEVLILEHGRVLAQGTPWALRQRHATDGADVSLEDVYMRLSGKPLEASEPEEVEG